MGSRCQRLVDHVTVLQFNAPTELEVCLHGTLRHGIQMLPNLSVATDLSAGTAVAS